MANIKELYIGALDLSPYLHRYEGTSEERFLLSCLELPPDLSHSLFLMRAIKHQEKFSFYGFGEVCQCWIYRVDYRPLNSGILTLSKRPILNRSLYADEPTWFIHGCFVDFNLF